MNFKLLASAGLVLLSAVPVAFADEPSSAAIAKPIPETFLRGHNTNAAESENLIAEGEEEADVISTAEIQKRIIMRIKDPSTGKTVGIDHGGCYEAGLAMQQDEDADRGQEFFLEHGKYLKSYRCDHLYVGTHCWDRVGCFPVMKETPQEWKFPKADFSKLVNVDDNIDASTPIMKAPKEDWNLFQWSRGGKDFVKLVDGEMEWLVRAFVCEMSGDACEKPKRYTRFLVSFTDGVDGGTVEYRLERVEGVSWVRYLDEINFGEVQFKKKITKKTAEDRIKKMIKSVKYVEPEIRTGPGMPNPKEKEAGTIYVWDEDDEMDFDDQDSESEGSSAYYYGDNDYDDDEDEDNDNDDAEDGDEKEFSAAVEQ